MTMPFTTYNLADQYDNKLQIAIDDRDYETAFQAASWLANHFPVQSYEAAHYLEQANYFSNIIAGDHTPEEDVEDPDFDTEHELTRTILGALRAMSAGQTHAAPMNVTIDVNIDLGINPPF